LRPFFGALDWAVMSVVSCLHCVVRDLAIALLLS